MGSDSLLHGEGAVNVALGRTVAIRVAGAGITRHGYISNGHDDNKAYAGRAKLLFKSSADMKLVLGAEYAHLGGKGPGAVPIATILAGNHDTTDVAFGYQDVDYSKFWRVLTADVGPGVLFVVPALQRTEGVTLGSFGGNFAYDPDAKVTRHKSPEIRYSSQAGSSFEWNVGYYHYDSYNVQQTISGACQDTAGNFVVPAPGFNAAPPGPPGPASAGGCLSAANAIPTSYAPEYRKSATDGIFGQGTIPVAERLLLIGGIRHTWKGSRASAWPIPMRRHSCCRDSATSTSTIAPVSSSTSRHDRFLTRRSPGPLRLRRQPLSSGEDAVVRGRCEELAGRWPRAGQQHRILPRLRLVPADRRELYSLSAADLRAHDAGARVRRRTGDRDLGRDRRTAECLPHVPRLATGWDQRVLRRPVVPKFARVAVQGGYQQDIDPGNAGTITPRADFRTLSDQLVYPEQTAQPRSSPFVQKSFATGDLSIIYQLPGDRLSVTAYLKNVSDKFIKQSHFFGYAQLSASRTVGLVATYKF